MGSHGFSSSKPIGVAGLEGQFNNRLVEVFLAHRLSGAVDSDSCIMQIIWVHCCNDRGGLGLFWMREVTLDEFLINPTA